MPRAKFTTQGAKDYLLRFGYTVNNDFHYTKLTDKFRVYDLLNERYHRYSMQQIIYRVEQATTKRPEFDSEGLNHLFDIDFQPGRTSLDKQTRQEMFDFINSIEAQPGPVQIDKQARKEMYDFVNNVHEPYSDVTTRNEDRFLNSNPATRDYINDTFNKADAKNIKATIKRQLPNTVKQMKLAMNNNGIAIYEVPSDDIDQTALKQSILLSIQILGPQLLSKNVDVMLVSKDGSAKRFFLNENSIKLLNRALFEDNIPDVNDSNTEILSSYFVKDLASISFDITPRKGLNRRSAGFFPFINKSNINLEEYGIYSSINDVDLSESCLIHAIKQSQKLSSEELERLKHFIKTRTFLLENLPQICDEFNVSFNLRIISDAGKSSHREYGCSSRSIPLVVMYNHYMFDVKPNVSFYFINNYEECKNMSTMTVKKQGEYIQTQCSINIETLINKMIGLNLLVPMTDEELTTLMINYKPVDTMHYHHQRIINIPDKVFKSKPYHIIKPHQSKFFLGYIPEDNEVEERLDEIQSLVNSLP